jgi:hypothetical protein
MRSTIEVRHSSFSPLAFAALSTIAATSTLWGGAAEAGEELADDALVDGLMLALEPPLAGALPVGAAPLAVAAFA